jgi:hypothetical protein
MALKRATPPERPRPNILLYGPPKTWKTVAAASAPAAEGKMLYLNCDLPNATFHAHQVNPGKLFEPGWDDGPSQMLVDVREAINGANPPEVVVVDPVSELYRRLLEHETNSSLRPSLPKRGDVTVYVERFLRDLCEAPHVATIIICHELVMEQEGDSPTLYKPFTGTSKPTLGNKIAGMVDVIGYTALIHPPKEEGEEEEPKPYAVAQLVEAKGRLGGDRFDCLGLYRQLDLTEWFELIDNARPTKTEPKSQKELKAA